MAACRSQCADTGSGIPDDARERIFDRFYRGGARDPDGFGLGLAIVRQAVRVLGGAVDLSRRRRSANRHASR